VTGDCTVPSSYHSFLTQFAAAGLVDLVLATLASHVGRDVETWGGVAPVDGLCFMNPFYILLLFFK
jgi:hypothetical protein